MTAAQQPVPHPQRDLCPLCKGEGYVLSTHTSASQQRIEQVLNELDKFADDCLNDAKKISQGAGYTIRKYQIAAFKAKIALLREGEPK